VPVRDLISRQYEESKQYEGSPEPLRDDYGLQSVQVGRRFVNQENSPMSSDIQRAEYVVSGEKEGGEQRVGMQLRSL